MTRRLLAVAGILLFVTGAQAQAPEPVPANPKTPAATVNMRDPVVGDHWTYQVTDEIAGKVLETRTVMVTDLSKDSITTRFDVAGTGRSGAIVYDRGWSVVSEGPVRYLPNDGTGIRSPLALEASWKVSTDSQNSSNGVIFKRIGTARVSGKETLTTKAGTFETFVVETKLTSRNTKDPSRVGEMSQTTWYSPDLDHWVRRRRIVRENGHLVRNDMIELTDFGRKN